MDVLAPSGRFTSAGRHLSAESYAEHALHARHGLSMMPMPAERIAYYQGSCMRAGHTRRSAITRLVQFGGPMGATIIAAGYLRDRDWAAAAQSTSFAALSRNQDGDAARLQTRPMASQPADVPISGLRSLGLAGARDALLYVPGGYQANAGAPLVVSLHGAGGDAEGGLYPLQPLADEGGFLLLAVPSRGRTWDAVLGRFGRDVGFIDQALGWTFERYAVDPEYVAVAGFSDGASYALSLGLANGDLFKHVMAFSPGFVAAAPARGQPRMFVSHGVADAVLPIDQCSRRIVPRLREASYDVTYQEFDGPHTVPPEIAESAANWFLASRAATVRSPASPAA
jgi:phospholipase/carboxylesterase